MGIYRKQANGVWQTGFPKSRIIEIFGPESSGKTTFCGQTMANAQKMFPKRRCAIIDTEHSLDVSYYAALGVDWAKTDLFQPDSGEEAMQIMDMLVKTGGYSIICLDSIAAMIPQAEADGEIGDAHMMLQARLLSQSMRKIVPTLTKPDVDTILLFTNQQRESPQKGLVTPGGRAMKFYASYRIKLWYGQKSWIKEGDETVGRVTTAQFIKNKTAPPFKQADMPIMFGHGVDNDWSLFDLCVSREIITQRGGWYYLGAMTIGNGRINCIKAMRSNKALGYTLYDMLLTDALASRGFHPDLTPIEGFDRSFESGEAVVEKYRPQDVTADPLPALIEACTLPRLSDLNSSKQQPVKGLATVVRTTENLDSRTPSNHKIKPKR